jgi:hypothetical protein
VVPLFASDIRRESIVEMAIAQLDNARKLTLLENQLTALQAENEALRTENASLRRQKQQQPNNEGNEILIDQNNDPSTQQFFL